MAGGWKGTVRSMQRSLTDTATVVRVLGPAAFGWSLRVGPAECIDIFDRAGRWRGRIPQSSIMSTRLNSDSYIPLLKTQGPVPIEIPGATIAVRHCHRGIARRSWDRAIDLYGRHYEYLHPRANALDVARDGTLIANLVPSGVSTEGPRVTPTTMLDDTDEFAVVVGQRGLGLHSEGRLGNLLS